MLELILKLYAMAMAVDVRSPMPHLFGPPGCGKSTVVEQAAELIGVNLHVVNLARLSPLELEGVQMPHGSDDQMVLRLLHSTIWTQLKEGDIILFDEFLRAFPEVYNGLLDIFTSRRVADLKLPRVFIIGASNSTVSYDKALEDRLMHLPVPDPRTDRKEKKRLARLIVDQLGLMPEMADSMEMTSLLDTEVLPMFEILDQVKGKASGSPAMLKGRSIRNLIGQARLRNVQCDALDELLRMNNTNAARQSKWQYVFLPDASHANSMPAYEGKARQLKDNPRLSELQAENLQLNLQLIEMEQIRNEKKEGTVTEDDDFLDDLLS